MSPTPDQLQQQLDEVRQRARTWKIVTIILLIGFLLLGWWQCATWRYLDKLRVHIDSVGVPPDGTGAPKPPPKL